jgi:putative glycosyl hydrolase/Big-like domain-containing protein
MRLAVLLAMLAVPLFAASTASAARSEFYGIAQGTLDLQDYEGMQAAKVHTERFLLRWKSVEPTKGSFHWTDVDNFIGQLASHGIRPLPFAWGSPSWVGSGAIAQPPLNSAADQTAWKDFLTRAVSRYGPGGSYWGTPYHSKYGSSATALPVEAWQIWNEPNLKKFFTPGATVAQSAQKYAQLLKISHDTIKAKDPKAQIVLAGMPGFGDSKAWIFLDNIYAVAGIKNYFDVTALHPYARDLDEFRTEVSMFRASIVNHSDAATPMWLTEWGWGSGPADQYGHNVGLTGQQTMLNNSVKLVLQQRTAWNVQRMYWFLWRDPEPGSFYAHLCSICGTGGLLRYNRTAKPAYSTFKGFTTETTPPVASITSGPTGPTGDSTPTFGFASNEAGSTFQCHFDSNALKTCASPLTPASPLSEGTHTLFVKAIDAVGNESTIRSRTFTVDTVPPAPPQITATTPASPANNNSPLVKGSAAAGSTVKLYKTAGCTGTPVASGPATQFASPGLSATVTDNTTTSFRARAADAVGNLSACSSARTYVEDSTAPETTITAGPSGTTTDNTPTFSFTSSQSGSTFQCRFDSQPFAACSGPGASHTPSTPLSAGSHTFAVRATDQAKNTDPTPATRTFTVII